MNANKVIIISSIIIIILIISLPTAYKVVTEHNKNLYKVVEEKIIKYAQDCYYDDICQDDKITLKFLYDNYHLEKMTDPVTKEYYNENSFVQRENLNFTFVRVP